MHSCKFCEKVYNKKVDVNKHELYCELNTERLFYTCDKCNKEFSKRHGLIGHKGQCGKEKIKKEPIKYIRKKKESNHICKHCNNTFENGHKLGGHISHCKLNPNFKLYTTIRKEGSLKLKGKKLSEETKKKISISRIKYLKENPDKVPYLLNHNSKVSYPEKTVIKYLNELEVKGWIHQMSFSIYQIDFAFPEYKLAVEIDGATHTLPNVIEIDKRKDQFLKENDWRVLRITATKIKENVYDCINLILNELGEKQIEIPIEFLNKKYIKEEKLRVQNEKIKLNLEEKHKNKMKMHQERIELIKNSNIDSNSKGYYEQLGNILNLTGNGVKKFMSKYMK